MTASESKYALSIIVPTYNRSELLEYTLRSLVMQNIGKECFEVVIGDDGSSDDTRAVVDRYGDRLNIKYVFQEDRGYRVGSARNNAIRIASGKICLFIDSGILLDADALERHIAFHDENGPDRAAVGYIFGFDREEDAEISLRKLTDPNDAAASIREVSRYEVYFDLREQHYLRHNDQIHLLPAPWIYFWMGHISVPRKNLLEVGLFDEDYDGNWGVEDNDLGYRLHRSGVRIHLLRAAQSIHYPHDSHKPEKERQGRENCRLFHQKYPTTETALFLKHYGEDAFVDINVLCMELENKGVQSIS